MKKKTFEEIKEMVNKSETRLEAIDIVEKYRDTLGDQKADSVIKTIKELFADQPKDRVLDIRF